MTLLDAPKFDEVRDPPQSIDSLRLGRFRVCSARDLVAFLRPARRLALELEYPHARPHGRQQLPRRREQNDLQKAYGIWLHDTDWQQHQAQLPTSYSFSRFQQDWSRTSPTTIRRHPKPQDCRGACVWKRAAGRRTHQRPKERRSKPDLRPQNAHPQTSPPPAKNSTSARSSTGREAGVSTTRTRPKPSPPALAAEGCLSSALLKTRVRQQSAWGLWPKLQPTPPRRRRNFQP